MIAFHDSERVILEVRRHWLPLLGRAILLVLLAIAPFALEWFIAGLGERAVELLVRYQAHILLLEMSWILLLWLSFAIAWTNHYLDILIITDTRVLDVDQIGLFSRDVAELRVNDIEDIRVETPGFLAHWLGFGTIDLQTAAESKAFTIMNIENPERVRALISEVREAYYRR